LNTSPRLEPANAKIELAWIDGFLANNTSLLETHIDLTEELERSLLSGSAVSGNSIFERATSEFGYSMTWLASSVAVKQLYEGLEAQKAYVSGIRSEDAPARLQFFLYWWSVRAEETTTAKHYSMELLQRLESWEANTTDSAMIKYYILNQIPESGSEADLLNIASSSTAIDAYEMLLAIAEVSIAESRSIVADLKPIVARLSKVLTDSRLLKIAFAMDIKNVLSNIPIPDAEIRNRVYAHPKQTLLLNDSVCPSELAAASMSGQVDQSNIDPSFKLILIESFQSLGRSGIEREEAVEKLAKFGLILGHIPLGRWLAAVVSCHTANMPPFSQRHQAIMFINSQDSIFEAPSALRNELVDEFYRHISIPQSSAVGEAIQVQQFGFEEPDEPATLIKSAELNFDLRRLVELSDSEAILAKSIELEIFGINRQQIFYKINSLLDLDRVEQALEEAVELLMKDESLILSMPARRL